MFSSSKIVLSSSFFATLKSIFLNFFLMYLFFLFLQFIFQWFFSQCLQSLFEDLKNDSSQRFFLNVVDWRNDLRFVFLNLIKTFVFENLFNNLLIRSIEKFFAIEKLRLFHLNLYEFFLQNDFVFRIFKFFLRRFHFVAFYDRNFSKYCYFDVLKLSKLISRSIFFIKIRL